MQQTSTLVSTILKTTKNKQQKVTLVDEIEPSDSLIQNILNYSKSLTVKKSDSVGFIEVVVVAKTVARAIEVARPGTSAVEARVSRGRLVAIPGRVREAAARSSS